MYADDTALITNNVSAMNRLLAKIESHAQYYGVTFNKTKCVSMCFNTEKVHVFAAGGHAPQPNDTKYLGALFSQTHDLRKEVTQRISA